VECQPQLALRASPGSGVPLVEPLEELRGPSGYAPRGFEPRAGGEIRIFGFYNNEKKRRKKIDEQAKRDKAIEKERNRNRER